jgi:hypothetical protein
MAINVWLTLEDNFLNSQCTSLAYSIDFARNSIIDNCSITFNTVVSYRIFVMLKFWFFAYRNGYNRVSNRTYYFSPIGTEL